MQQIMGGSNSRIVSKSGSQVLRCKSRDTYMAQVSEIFPPNNVAPSGWDVWDDKHVHFPASKHFLYPQSGHKNDGQSNSSKENFSKWELIKTAYRKPITSVRELESAIRSYNHAEPDLNFENLHQLFSSLDGNMESFFSLVLPKTVSIALSISELFQHPIPLLRKGYANSITLTQEQVACLLANAFLCTYPPQPEDYPPINFFSLYSSAQPHPPALSVEKLKFIVHYLRRIATDGVRSDRYITFARHSLAQKPNWLKLNHSLSSCEFSTKGTIEDDGLGMLQMDFANCYIGGNLMGKGATQEEIRFLICPELIVSRLFVERMDDDEVVLITGCERYSSYKGYSRSLTWAGDFRDQTRCDSAGRINTQIVAADAIRCNDQVTQYQSSCIIRELNKALAAFHPVPVDENESRFVANDVVAIATGNWGCGSFGGDARLKFLIQLLAASVADRGLVYFTFSDESLTKELEKMHRLLCDRKMTVGQVFHLLTSYSVSGAGSELFAYIYKQLR